MNNRTKRCLLLLVSAAAFNFLVYFGSRLIASDRPHFCLATAFDSNVPALSWTVLIYCGAYLFWIVNYCLSAFFDRYGGNRFIISHFIGETVCFFAFILLPTTMLRPETAGTSVFDRWLELVYRLDKADNLMPSIHCFASWLCWIGVRNNLRIPRWYQNMSLLTAIAICISTLTVKQHVIADAAAGIFLAESSYCLAGQGEQLSRKEVFL